MSNLSLPHRIERIAAGFAPTPVVRLEHDRVELFAKLEYGNPNGSTKDRAAHLLLARAVRRGELTLDSTVVESSSGNFAISLASFCRVLGVPFVPVIDPNTNPTTECFLRAACDLVYKVDQRDATGGYLRTRLGVVKDLMSTWDNVYWPDQYANTDAVDAHHDTTGAELVADLDRIDYVFVGVGTGATIAGLSRRLPVTTRVIAVDVAGSAIFGQPPASRRIPGIGSSIRPPLVDLARIDDVVIVPESDTVAACHLLLRRHGLFAGGSSGSVYAAVEQYFAGYRGARPRVAFLCADRGTAYADTVYRTGWIESFAEAAATRSCFECPGR